MGVWENLKATFYGLGSKKNTDGKPSDFDKKQPMAYQLRQQFFYHSKMEVENWRKATAQARSPLQPRRYELLRIYQEALYDLELQTAIRNALTDVEAAPFVILKNGIEDKKSKDLFKRTWFRDFVRLALEVEFWGYSMIDFDPKMKEGEFTEIAEFPREHYRPETGEVLKYVHDTEGVTLADLQKMGSKAFALGGKKNYGILELASLAVIRKTYTLTDWSIRNEKFGMPFVWLKTDFRRDSELAKREKMLADFGSNGWGIGGETETLEFHEPQSAQGGHLTFKDFILYTDSSIDKLINGQTGTTNEKAHVGAAQVHERTQGQYTKSRLERIQAHVNDTLIPFLMDNGYKLNNRQLQFTEIWDENPKKQIEATIEDPTLPVDPAQVNTKKKGVNKAVLASLYNNVCCDDAHLPKKVALGTSINDLFEKAIKNVFDNKIKAGELDPDIWKYNVNEIWGGVTEGFGTSYADQDKATLEKLKTNVHVFAAFKNHANQADVAALLVDANGDKRSFADFKELALQVSNNYNVVWLQAEYQLAQRAATMSAEWDKIQLDKDILPNLKYVTAGDDRVRLAHEKLDGIVLPIDDAFWNTFYPPNGWGCRCTVYQTDEGTKHPDYTPDDKEVPPAFQVNVGKEKVIFGEDHPFFDVDKETGQRIRKQLTNLIRN